MNLKKNQMIITNNIEKIEVQVSLKDILSHLLDYQRYDRNV